MIRRIVDFALDQKLLVLAFTLLMIAAGRDLPRNRIGFATALRHRDRRRTDRRPADKHLPAADFLRVVGEPHGPPARARRVEECV